MIFMLVILKIPIVYLCTVIWWAIRSEREPDAPATLIPSQDPELGGPHWRRMPPAHRRPPRGPQRRPAARSAPARMYARR
jgi:hypothetical protein